MPLKRIKMSVKYPVISVVIRLIPEAKIETAWMDSRVFRGGRTL